ncbi:MAG: pyrroline-5-carboxylate reductase [Candidatus Kerfeldbacteria bacterium]|nr:pyrroline-5-carboxylate reductase [Candidatus Kerfeldbacteria bacterium]
MYKHALVVGGHGTIGQIMVANLNKLLNPPIVTVANRQSHHAQLAQTADVIFFTVKPQDFSAAATATKPGISNQLIISLMAGVSTTTLVQQLNNQRVIRAMPNLPAKIGLGMTVWTATTASTTTDKEFVQALFRLMGQQLEVMNDQMIDQATAVSASGPAYLFLLAEQLLQAASYIGLPADQARLLVTETLRGASTLLADSAASPASIRAQVTSTGGTTAAAITTLPLAELQQYWNTAIMAAYQRAKELSH